KLLGSRSNGTHTGRCARRALLWNSLAVSAIVTHERLPVLVISQAYGAVHAFRYPTTIFTAHHGRISSAVLEDDHLFFRGKRFTNVVDEKPRELALDCFVATLLRHVGQDHVGQIGL